MSTPLAEAFVRISLDMKYLQAQQQQAQKMLTDFANQKISRSMTPTDVYNQGFAKALQDANKGAVNLADALQVVRQMEATAAEQARAMAEGIREANAAADPLISKMRNLQQLKTLVRGGFLSGEDAAIAARRMNGPTAGEADEKRLASIATQAYESTRTAAERYQQAVENLNAARSKMGEDTYQRAMAQTTAEYERARAAADPAAKAQQRINALIEQGTPAAQRLAAAEKELIAEMQKLNIGQQQQQLALSGLRTQFGQTVDSGRRMNAMIQQASFGAQDFITVMAGGGGLQMALMSAANNAAQMAAIAGGVGGAFAGLAVTIAAVAIPAIGQLVTWWVRLGLATDEALKKQEQYADFLANRMKSAEEVANEGSSGVRQAQKIEDMESYKEASGELKRQRQSDAVGEKERENLQKSLERERAALSAAEEERKRLGKKSTGASEGFKAFRKAAIPFDYALNMMGFSTEGDSGIPLDFSGVEVTNEQNKAREALDKEIENRRKRIEDQSRRLGRSREETEERAANNPALMNRLIDLQEDELEKGNKKHRMRKMKESETARKAYDRENLSIAGDMNEYESRRIAVQEKFEDRRKRLEDNRFITEQERNRSVKLAEQARNQDLDKLNRDELHHKASAVREAERMDSEARNIGNPHAMAKARIAAEYREKHERLDENRFITDAQRKQIKANLEKAEAIEKERAGYQTQIIGLGQLHSEIQKSLYKSPAEQAAQQTSSNTGKIVDSSERAAKAVEKIAENQSKQTATYA